MRKNSFYIFLIIAIIFGIIFTSSSLHERKRREHYQSLVMEAAPYEQELRSLQAEQQNDKISLQISNGGKVIMTFIPSSREDVASVKEYSEYFHFEPTILLDCTKELNVLTEILDAATQEQFEILLGCMYFDDTVLTKAAALREQLLLAEYPFTPIFFLRNTFESGDAINKILNQGYSALILYSEDLKPGILTNNTPYLPYYIVRADSAIEQAFLLTSTLSSKAVIIFTFQEFGKTSIRNLLVTANLMSQGLSVPYCSLSEGFQDFQKEYQDFLELLETYQLYEEARTKRVAELNQIIHDIYSRWDDF